VARLLWTVGAAVLVIAIAAAYCQYDIAEARRSNSLADRAATRVHVGMDFDQALPLLSDAWHHTACAREYPQLHLFFFGSTDLSRSGVLMLTVDRLDGRETITAINGVEHYQLFLYQRCSDLDLSRAKGPLWR
jgi:uncharacterized membrane protein